MLATTDVPTMKGRRDRAMLALMLGCGSRRSPMRGYFFSDITLRRICAIP
jgi:hypothetical protein